ncbi:EAL domain-containing protein [Paenibacillus swuensis]|uniref:EAL domain-containing protein n=1 Tax=Paenibacillus swuensis TaxID=1178515 RepID=UPI000837B90B|nr:EAL domain-containing protein [Paenibacillus swuensis]
MNWTPSQRKEVITSELIGGLMRREFSVRYQPQINTHSEALIGVEALCRWTHPILGVISPAQFIPIAEQAGLIPFIGEWILDAACKQLMLWKHRHGVQLALGINVSAYQLRDAQFLSVIQRTLESTGFPADYLHLELTEGAHVHDDMVEQLRAIRIAGVGISMDDFGTGYSSLSLLSRLPVTTVKIAREMINGKDVSERAEIIFAAIVSLAGQLNINVIAEGVETSKQLEFVKNGGCSVVQGYYFNPPLSAGEFERAYFMGRA